MRALLITVASGLLTSAAIANAFIQKRQFFPAVVYITKSNPSMAVSFVFLHCFAVQETNFLIDGLEKIASSHIILGQITLEQL